MSSIRHPVNRHIKEDIRKALERFEKALPGSPAAEYLNDRHIGQRTAATHRLGYVDPADPLEGWERFATRLAVPYLNAHGDPVWIKFRATPLTRPNKDGKIMKYSQQEGSEARLFNTQALSMPGDTLCLVEGEFDVITLTALGIPAVGVPGAGSWKAWFHRALQGYERMVLFHDADDIGRDGERAGEKLVRAVKERIPDIIPIAPPGGFNDISEAFVAGHGEAIRALAFGWERTDHGENNAEGQQGGSGGGFVQSPGPVGSPTGERSADPSGDAQPVNGFNGISNPDSEPPF